MWVCEFGVGTECSARRLVIWVPEGGLEEGSLFVPTPRPRTANTHCAGMAGGRAASRSRHTPGTAAPFPSSSCWTGEEGRGKFKKTTELRLDLKKGNDGSDEGNI